MILFILLMILLLINGPRYSGICFIYNLEYRSVVEAAYNQIKVTMLTKGDVKSAVCSVIRTKPYTNMKYENFSSEEDGLGIGATRNTSCKCGWANKNRGRIVGGTETLPNEYPFAVILFTEIYKSPSCGGSIITTYHILSAAHCTDLFGTLKHLSLIIGEHDVRTVDESKFTKKLEIDYVVNHPEYDDITLINDISVVISKSMIEFNNAVGPVCLPNARYNLIDKYVKVMGWGLLSERGQLSPVLREVNLKVTDANICEIFFPKNNTDAIVCAWAPKRDSCQVDSGGPVVWIDPVTKRYTLIGVVSGGGECAAALPGFNANVYHYLDWIKKTIQETIPQDVCI